MGEDADRLRQEIDQKRDDAASKIDQIEERMQDTAQMAKETVRDTTQAAKESVMEVVDQTVAKVKEGFDVHQQVEQRPLVAVGAAMLGGFLLGGILGNDRQGGRYDRNGVHADNQGGVTASLRQAAQRSGLDDTIEKAASALLGSLKEQISSVVEQGFPQLAERIKQTQGTGGEQRSESEYQTRPGSTPGI